VGSWEKLGRNLGLLVLVATLTAATQVGGLAGPPPAGSLSDATAVERAAGPPGAPADDSPLPGPASSSSSTVRPENTDRGVSAPSSNVQLSSGALSAPAASSRTGSAPPSARPTIIVHTVVSGETVTSIAARYGVSVATVAASAGVTDPDRIYPGQKLSFPSVDGVLYVVEPGDTLAAVAERYDVSEQTVASANDITDPKTLAVGRTLIIPGGREPARGEVSSDRTSDPAEGAAVTAASAPGGAAAVPAAVGVTLAWPIRGPISSPYGIRWGRLHTGIDIAAAYGTTIRAAAAGKVTFVGWYGSYGRSVLIDHGGGLSTLYAHASAILVSVGQQVSAGTPVAKVGSSGNSTGPHLHFEVRVDGKPCNPLSYLGE